jgi:hypothetical protein
VCGDEHEAVAIEDRLDIVLADVAARQDRADPTGKHFPQVVQVFLHTGQRHRRRKLSDPNDVHIPDWLLVLAPQQIPDR